MKFKAHFPAILCQIGIFLLPFLFTRCEHYFFSTDIVPLGSADVLDVVYSSDGSKLAAGVKNGSLFVLDTNSKAILNHFHLPELKKEIKNLQIKFSEDGTTLYSCADLEDRPPPSFVVTSAEISGWDLTNPLQSLPIVQRTVTQGCDTFFFGDWLAIRSEKSYDYATKVYDTKTNALLFSIPDRISSPVYKAPYLFVQSIGQIWDLRQQKKVFTSSFDLSSVKDFSSTQLLLPCINTYDLCLLNIQKNQLDRKLYLPEDLLGRVRISSAKFSHDGTRVVATLIDPYKLQGTPQNLYWCLWDVSLSEPIACKNIAHYESPPTTFFVFDVAVDFLPTTNNRIVIHYNGFWNDLNQTWKDQVWDAESGHLIAILSVKNPDSPTALFGIPLLRFSPMNDQLAGVGPNPGEILFWDLGSL